MSSKERQIGFVALWLLLLVALPTKAQNNPYVDDKLVHFGFSLGVDFLSYGVEEADTLLQLKRHGEIYHARTSNVGVGFSVGFISDLRLARHLNLRFCPGMHFGERTITYMKEVPGGLSDSISGTNCTHNKPSVLCLPISHASPDITMSGKAFSFLNSFLNQSIIISLTLSSIFTPHFFYLFYGYFIYGIVCFH